MRRHGRVRRSINVRITPPGVDYYEVGGPTSFGPPAVLRRARAPEKGDVRYARRMSYFIDTERVWGFMTVEAGAHTRGGVTIGDAQDVVRERYPDADCFVANEGTEYVTFPLCKVVVRKGLHLWFGADPVQSIWLAAEGSRAYVALRRMRRATA